MKSRLLVIIILITISGGVWASQLRTECLGAYLSDGKANLLTGVNISWQNGNKTYTLSTAGWGKPEQYNLTWPSKYFWAIGQNNFHFYPGAGFLINNWELFFQGDRENLIGGIGGSFNLYASLLNGAGELKLYRLPEGYFQKAFALSATKTTNSSDLFFPMYELKPGVTAYLCLLYNLYPNMVLKAGYLGNLTTNQTNSFWAEFIIPEWAFGLASFGVGIENGDTSFLPPGLFGTLSYALPLSDFITLETGMRYGSLTKKATGFVSDLHLAPRIKLILSTDTNELTMQTAWETKTSKDWSGQTQRGYGKLKWKIEYQYKAKRQITIYTCKDSSQDISIGLRYKF